MRDALDATGWAADRKRQDNLAAFAIKDALIAKLEAERDVAHAAGYRAGVEDAAKRITASIQMLKNLGMTENAEAFVAAAEDIRALLNSEADAALQTKGGA